MQTHLQWQSIDSWLPRDGRSRRRDYKEAEELLGMRNTFIILMWWWLHVCVLSRVWLLAMASWVYTEVQLYRSWQVKQDERTGNWPFNSGLWWSSDLMSSSGGVRRTRLLNGMHSWESKRKGFKRVSTDNSYREYFIGGAEKWGTACSSIYVNYTSIKPVKKESRWTNNWHRKPEQADSGASREEQEAVPPWSMNTTSKLKNQHL